MGSSNESPQDPQMSAQIRVLSAERYLQLAKQKLPNLVTLDCTWYPSDKDGHAEYVREHISGARYFPFVELKSPSPYPHMLPRSFAEFSAEAGKLGLSRDDLIVVYDQQSYLGAPRAAWLLSTFRHPQVFLLDNYQKYKELGGRVESGDSPAVEPREYARSSDTPADAGKWLSYEDVKELVESGETKNVNLIDARGAARYTGTQPEPRPGVQSGHIPRSKNVPFTEVVDSAGHFKSGDELDALLKSKGVDPTKPSVIMCGSGVTACVVKTAIDQTYGVSSDIYDGSWGEWGVRAPEELVEKS